MLPKDPYILLSYINMKLRDEGITLEELCKRELSDTDQVEEALKNIKYIYNDTLNTFIKN